MKVVCQTPLKRDWKKNEKMKKMKKEHDDGKLIEEDLIKIFKPTNKCWAFITFSSQPCNLWPRYKSNKIHIDWGMIAMIFIKFSFITRGCDW